LIKYIIKKNINLYLTEHEPFESNPLYTAIPRGSNYITDQFNFPPYIIPIKLILSNIIIFIKIEATISYFIINIRLFHRMMIPLNRWNSIQKMDKLIRQSQD